LFAEKSDSSPKNPITTPARIVKVTFSPEAPKLPWLIYGKLGLEYKVETGKLDENMFRSRGYQIFVIPEKKKLIFVNNEEGHATRIVHGFRDFDQNDKFGVIEKDIIDYLSDLNVDELDLDESIIVEKINYPGNEEEYKQKMKEAVLFVLTKKNTEMFDPKEKKKGKCGNMKN